jgi:CRISPR-associated protein (TIGR03986 family)
VKGTNGRPGDVDAKAFFDEANHGHVTHDRYLDGSFSGRVLCRLTAEDPFVVGARQVEGPGGSHTIEPFMVNKRPAIPASSLRGLISSIAEAASNSALRVLNDKALSVRMTMDEALPAIGMVREETVNGKAIRVLQPLTLPMNLPWNSAGRNAILPNDCLGIYEKCSPPAYVEGYRKIPNPDPRERRPLPGVEPSPGTFLAMQRPLSFSSDNKREFWWAKLRSFSFTRGTVSFPTGGQRLNSFNQSHLVGSQIDDLLSEKEYQIKGRPQDYTRGILRVLGFEGHEKEIPHGKKHEIFIPFSPEQEDINRAKTFEMKMALSAFERLAAERRSEQREDEAYLPFDLKRPALATKKEIRLRDGDLVFFKASGGRITEIALSSIWRKGKETVHAYFASVSPELLPMNSNRQTISLAEQLFGFVEEMKKGKAEERTAQSARALAGRVRFSFGFLDPAVQEGDFWEYDEPKPLKLLSSPKLPCPALYFYQQGGGYIMKRQLTVGRHFPQGRKFYLHRKPSEQDPWLAQIDGGDKHAKQRLYARPVKKDSIFYFHVEFHNLSKDELALLCYALRPSEKFRHKLGLGKPIGLGKVQIEPLGLFYVPRTRRYKNDTLSDFRFLALRDGLTASWPWTKKEEERYACEAATAPLVGAERGDLKTFKELQKTCRDAMDERIRWAIELIGDPGSITDIPVHYPRLHDQGEEELYRWFMENENKDRTDRFPLPPIVVNNPLPTLPHLTPTPRPPRPGGGGGRGPNRGGGKRDNMRNRHP